MPKTATAGEQDPNDDVEERARDRALQALELPGPGYELAATRLAVGDVYDYLRGQGQATAKEFEQNVYPQTNAGTYFNTQTAWWRDGCKPYLRAMPGVEAPDAAGSCWRFVGVA